MYNIPDERTLAESNANAVRIRKELQLPLPPEPEPPYEFYIGGTRSPKLLKYKDPHNE